MLAVDGDAADHSGVYRRTREDIAFLADELAGPAVDLQLPVCAEIAMEAGGADIEYGLAGLGVAPQERNDSVEAAMEERRVAGVRPRRVALDLGVIMQLRARVGRDAGDFHRTAEVHRA